MIKKILLSLAILSFALASFKLALASEVTGNLNPGLDTGIAGVTRAAPTLSPGAGTFSASQSVSLTSASATKICYTTDGASPACATAATCTTGTALNNGGSLTISVTTTLKSAACYADASTGPVATSVYTITPPASGGGGGGGATAVYCSSVTYSDWNTNCFGSVQSRTVTSQSPSNCTLTSAQQLATQRACQIATTTPVVDPVTSPEAVAPAPAPTPIPNSPTGANLLGDIATESGIIGSKNTDSLLTHLGNKPDTRGEQASLVKYSKILGLDKKINTEEQSTINDFIFYGTRSTQRLGAGQRGSVINSYYQAYRKLPNSEAEWSDVIKIANGRWPVERSQAAEDQAKLEFRKVYARRPVMTNNTDENAIMVIAYGLLPLQRNLKSEAVASKTFAWVYAHPPVNALAWNVVRAIAYSGAKR